MIGFQNRRDICALAAVILHSLHIALHMAVDNDLTAHIRGGFEQNGIHAGVRGNTGRLGLYHLCAAHL